MKQINMTYPYKSGNELWDGKEHIIIPNDLLQFEINGSTYYLMNYRDETFNEENVTTLLTLDENGNYFKRPLDDYTKLGELIDNIELYPADIDILPNNIRLGSEIEIDTLLNQNSKETDYENNNLETDNVYNRTQKPQVYGNDSVVHNPNVENIELEMDSPRIDRQALYIAYIVDSNRRYIPVSIYNQYLDGLYEIRPNERNIDGVDCILVTQDDIDYISRVSHEPNYKPDYRRKPNRYNAEFDNNLDGIVMDYPNMRNFPNLPNNRLWDGRTHSISPLNLQRFVLNGRTFYFMNYIDNDYDNECITLLEQDRHGNIVKIPLDNYDKLPELLSRVNLTQVSLNILPNHIHLGNLLEIDYLESLTNKIVEKNDFYDENNNWKYDDNLRKIRENLDENKRTDGIRMDYPELEDYKFLNENFLWDGTSHEIKPKEFYEFKFENITFYYMKYDDLKFKVDCETLLFKTQTGEIRKAPLDNYEKLSELLENVELKEISWNILPNHISLGTLETDYLINLTTQNKEDINVSNEELNSIKKQIADLVYPKKNIDEITDEFINNFNPNAVTSQFDDNDIDKFNELKSKYNKLKNNKNELYKEDYANLNSTIGNIEMDYPTNETYSYIDNRLWDGKTHNISPQNLKRFDLNGRVYYYMEYIDNTYNTNCITLLTRTEKGEIRKVPLDDYEKLSELLNRVNAKKVSLSILPKHINLELLEIDYLLKLNKKNDYSNKVENNKHNSNNNNSQNSENSNQHTEDDNITKKRKRIKVVDEKTNIKNWFKKHPRLRTIALGLALALTIYLGMSSLMVINSALWGALGGKGAICGLLHGINIGLSRIVGFGAFNFAESGLYLNGAGQALYEITAPTLIKALGTLAISAPVCKTLIEKIRSRKKRNNRDELIQKLSTLTPEQYSSLPEDLRNEIANLNTNQEKEERNVGRHR